MPYDWTWWGYLCGAIFQFKAFFIITIFCGCILSIWYAIFMAIEAMARDIKLHLNGLNEEFSIPSEKYQEIKEKLCNIFELQASIIEFSTTKIFNPIMNLMNYIILQNYCKIF